MVTQNTLLQTRKLKLRWFIALSTLPLLGVLSAFGIIPQSDISFAFNQNVVEEITLPQPSQTAESSEVLVQSYIQLMSTDAQSLALILKLVSHGEYVYYHSIAVSIFSILISKAAIEFDPKTIQNIGLGGFLHDIGHSLISEVQQNERVIEVYLGR